MKKAFESKDTDKTGIITKEELTAVLKGLGEDVSEDVVNQMIVIMNTDCDHLDADNSMNFYDFVETYSDANL